jgi:MoxR-like ATPase
MSRPPDNPFVRLAVEKPLGLDASDRYPAAGHLWSQSEIDALILAWAARRPLLVRGEAGSGKSQIARAAAEVLGSQPLVEVIHPRFEALDLLYRVDSVGRLADAHLQRLDESNEKYVKRGRLWEAFARGEAAGAAPVLLVDEIDKADADVPNALLEVLGNRSFTVPPLNDRVVRAEAGRLPLVVITTNEERELPPAFVRRCVVLNLNPPKDQAAFVKWLIDRGSVHHHLDVADTARRHAAGQVFDDRQAAVAAGYPPVGLAEYIDLLTALDELTRDSLGPERSARQLAWLQRLSVYALVKNADQPQDRPPKAPMEAPAPEAGPKRP